jgi:phosphoserine phosphatase
MKMTQGVYYLKWILKDGSFDFQRLHFDHEAKVIAFKHKIWSDLSPFQAISFQPEAVHLSTKKLCVFDMDSTVINQEVIDEIARLFGFYGEVSQITEAAMQGHLDFSESLKRRCRLFSGYSEERLKEILPRLSLSRGAKELIAFLHQTGSKTAIVSGGFEFVLKHFQNQLGITRIHAHTLEIDPEHRFTGNVKEPIIDAHQKRILTAQMKTQYQCNTEETIVVGDGANDIEMMKEAGISVSFCGKPKLSEVANTLILERNLDLLRPLL